MATQFDYWTRLFLAVLVALSVATATQAEDAQGDEEGSVAAATQAEDEQVDEDAPASTFMDEILVTAERREADIQDVPLAVSAFSQETLNEAHVKDLATMDILVPNLTVEQHGDSGGVHVYLRGVGSANHTELGDPAVSFHVDEVYSPRPQGATMLMYDLERVEVLRGPQGTLFGRNSTAGTVNLVTAKPDLESFDSYVDVRLGDYNLVDTRAMINTPLSDKFGLRLAVATNRHDGFVDFQPRSLAVHSRKYQAADQLGARLTALWQPSDRWSITGAIDYFNDNGTGNLALMQTPRAGQDLRSALVDTAGYLQQDSLGFRLRADFDITPKLQLSYIGGYTEMERVNANDNDGGAIPGFKQEHRTEWSNFDSYSHEIHLSSSGESRFQWIAGAFLVREDNSIRFDIDISQSPVPPAPDVIVVYPVNPDDVAWAMSFIQPQRTLDSKAVFGQGTFAFTDSFRLTGGIRYTEEDKEDVGGRNWVCPQFGATIASGGHLIGPGGVVSRETCGSEYAPGTWPGGGANDGQTSDDKTTYLLRGEFDLAADSMMYLSYSTGFKSGGLSDGGRRHLPEDLTNYEVGWKSLVAGGKLGLNLAAFYMDYENMQVSAVEQLPSGQQQLVTSNAAASSIKGVEVEFGWFPSYRDSLTGFVSWLDAQYDDFQTIDTTFFDGSNLDNTVNLAGQPLRHAPEFSLTGIYEHRFGFANGGSLVPRITFHYQTATTISAFNDVYPGLYMDEGQQDAFTKTDLALRYEGAEGKWTIEGFVLNVEDTEVKTDIAAVGNSSDGTPTTAPTTRGYLLGFYNPPRIWGVRFSVKF